MNRYQFGDIDLRSLKQMVVNLIHIGEGERKKKRKKEKRQIIVACQKVLTSSFLTQRMITFYRNLSYFYLELQLRCQLFLVKQLLNEISKIFPKCLSMNSLSEDKIQK